MVIYPTKEEKKTRDWIERHYKECDENWDDPNKFEKFKKDKKFPKELEHIKYLNKNNHEKINCFIFAFGLDRDKEFLDKYIYLLAFGEYVKYLIKEKVLVSTTKPVTGDYIFYTTDDSYINHAGILQDDRTIKSKWKFGPVIKHSVASVPITYGLNVKYYRKTEYSKIKDCLYKVRKKPVKKLLQ